LKYDLDEEHFAMGMTRRVFSTAAATAAFVRTAKATPLAPLLPGSKSQTYIGNGYTDMWKAMRTLVDVDLQNAALENKKMA
jgi:hypothetical protein